MISLRSRARLDALTDGRNERLCTLLEANKGTIKRPEDRAAVEAFLAICYSLGRAQYAEEQLNLAGYSTENILRMLESIARFARLAGDPSVATPRAVWRYLADNPRG